MSVSYLSQDVAGHGPRTNGHRPDPAPNVGSALSTAVMVALHAPTVQPARSWHWRVGTDRVDLYGDRWRRTGTADSAGRQLMVSCGAALHHARIALRAMGYLPAVRRLPDRNRPDLVASVTAETAIPVTRYARELLQGALRRRRDGGFADAPVPTGALHMLREVAGSEGALLDLLDPAQVADLPEVTSPDGPGRYAALYGSGDRLGAWLRCGEALSAVWLSATAQRLAVRPVGAVAELTVPSGSAPVLSGAGGTPVALRAGVRLPYLLLHVGVPDA